MVDVDLALISAGGLPFSFLEKLRQLHIRTVETTVEDNSWIINGLAVRPGRVLMPEGISDRTRDKLLSYGVEITTVAYDKIQLNVPSDSGPYRLKTTRPSPIVGARDALLGPCRGRVQWRNTSDGCIVTMMVSGKSSCMTRIVGKIRVRNCHSEFLTFQIKNLCCDNLLLRTNMPGLLPSSDSINYAY
jgi:hypothetical protein